MPRAQTGRRCICLQMLTARLEGEGGRACAALSVSQQASSQCRPGSLSLGRGSSQRCDLTSSLTERSLVPQKASALVSGPGTLLDAVDAALKLEAGSLLLVSVVDCRTPECGLQEEVLDRTVEGGETRSMCTGGRAGVSAEEGLQSQAGCEAWEVLHAMSGVC